MTLPRSPVIAASAVSKRYAGAPAVQEASLALRAGRITCLLGPSGCGKTTLLRIIAGLERADEGEIRAENRIIEARNVFVPPEARRIGFVFQDLALFPHLSVLNNVAFGLRALGREERRSRAMTLLERFHLADRADAWPHSLSGGEQQRVAIARALAPGPAALLLDEPFSGLDGDLRAQVRDFVLSGLRESAAAVLVVTHDPEEAMLLGDELVLMARGRIVQSGTPEECYFRPRSAAAARLLGRANLVPAMVTGGVASCAFGMFPAGGFGNGPAVAMLRPDALQLEPCGIAAEVIDVRFGGSHYEVRLRAQGQEAVMHLGKEPPTPGEEVRIGIEPSRAALLPQEVAAD